jgi:copper chaperone NosL
VLIFKTKFIKRDQMIKIILGVMMLLVISGCTAKTHKHTMYKPFQMVKYDEATLVQSGKEKRYCHICGMDLVRFYKTSHAATKEDGSKHYQYCSIHCLEDHLGQGVTVKNPQVVDVATLKFIPVGEAYYVVGSKKRGTMSNVSKYAFKNRKDAELFQSKNGGVITDFAGARKSAQEDFKQYKQ